MKFEENINKLEVTWINNIHNESEKNNNKHISKNKRHIEHGERSNVPVNVISQ